MFTLNMSVGGNKKESVKLRSFKNALPANLMRGINKATAILEREIKRQLSKGGQAPRGKDEIPTKNTGPHLRHKNGHLRSSWKMQRARRTSNNIEGRVSSNSDYAAIHEFGGTIPAAVIKPRNSQALRFFVGGQWVFAKSANRPAVTIPKRPYVKPAIEKKRDDIQRVIAKEITKPLRRAG